VATVEALDREVNQATVRVANPHVLVPATTSLPVPARGTVLAQGAETAALRALADIGAGTADLAGAIRRMNRTLGPLLQAKIESCCLGTPALRAATGMAPPDAEEAAAIRGWRAAAANGDEPVAQLQAHTASIPLVHRQRVHGLVRLVLESGAPMPSAHVLAAIGLACGNVAWKAGVRKDLARKRRRLAIAAEQEEANRQAQAAIGDRLLSHVAEAPDRVWRRRLEELLLLTGTADREVRHTRSFVQSLPVQGEDLQGSLRGLIREVATATALIVKLQVEGEPRPLPASRQDALFRVAADALLSAAERSRAHHAVVVLIYGLDDVRLIVRDDGVGLIQRDLFGGPGWGVRAAQERIREVGGVLCVRNGSPRGAAIEATVPLRRAHVAGSRP
jgi:signal transduction histidine kinase